LGESVGRSSVHEGGGAPVSIEQTQLATFAQHDFLEFIQRRGEGSLHAAESLSKEYRSALTDASRLALSSSIAGRVAHLLLEMAVESEIIPQAQPKIQMSLRHEDLASMLGSSRETISRALSGLRRKGVISIDGSNMTLLNKEALEVLL
jgi:CRP/FNR family transcriptional regulator, cyclic AMP receptor protein